MLLVALAVTACRSSPSEMELLSDAELLTAFEQLHRRIYDVYEVELDRDQIHGLLSGSFFGRALTREYVEHFTTRVAMKRESTAIDILKVDYETLEVVGREGDRARIEVDWSIGGVVSHQRHRHARVNRYRAQYTVGIVASDDPDVSSDAPPAERLRILSTRLKNLERVGSVLERSSGFPLDQLPKSESGFMTAEEILRSGLLEGAVAEQKESEPRAGENP